MAMHFVQRTSRLGQFEGWDTDSRGQPENCRQHFLRDYHSPLWLPLAVNRRFYRFGGTTQQIASAPYNDFARMFTELKCEDLGVMALDLLSWDSDINSESTE